MDEPVAVNIPDDTKEHIENEPSNKNLFLKIAQKLGLKRSEAEEGERNSAFNLRTFRTLLQLEFRGSPLVLSLGLIAAILEGAVLPSFAIIFGKNFNLFAENSSVIQSTTWKYSLAFFGLGVGVNVLAYLRVSTFGIASEKLAKNLRSAAFANLVKQDVAFFDVQKSGELSNKLSADVALIQSGLAKAGQYIMNISQCIVGVIIGLAFGPELAGVLIALSP
eukprot:jgi/Galph1/2436/GphlegSOOS_G1133.1